MSSFHNMECAVLLVTLVMLASCCHAHQGAKKAAGGGARTMIKHYGTGKARERRESSAEASGGEISEEQRALCEELGYFQTLDTCRTSALMHYHSADGSCNNLAHPTYGKAGLPHKRYLPPQYEDGIGSIRETSGGRPLPSTRFVTNTVTENKAILVPFSTSMVMHYGQLLDHDIGHSPVEADTCGCQEHPNCISIFVPPNDPDFHTRCIPLSRSKTRPGPGCRATPREQFNQLTAFIDGSLLYGSSAEMVQNLRGERGLLRVSPNPFDESLQPLLPEDEGNAKCDTNDGEFKCGKAGDKRAAVQPGLTALHTVFMRFHNRIARQLAALNTAWGSGMIFLETRKIVSSVLQHITYNEYLPITMGQSLMDRYQLSVGKDHPYRGYQDDRDATMPNVFTHVAFRMGHSQISTNLTRVDAAYREVYEPVTLRYAFFNGSAIHDVQNGGVDSLVRGMLVQPLDKIDRFFSEDVTRFLFANPAKSFGLDLVAINTQRGRDHGIVGYTAWREYCGLPNASTFDDLADVMAADTINVLKKAYIHVDDIDAFIGMVVEEPLKGALVGPTVGCILGKHFRDLKYGDRFWYENPLGRQALTPGQQHAIRQTTLARVICDTLDNIDTIQPFVFQKADENEPTSSFAEYSATKAYPDETSALPGFSNARASCRDYNLIPALDLQPWASGNRATKCGTLTKQNDV